MALHFLEVSHIKMLQIIVLMNIIATAINELLDYVKRVLENCIRYEEN